MLVSVLLPTRQRPELMLKSVKSLIDRASDPSQIEVLLKIDTNDQDTYTSRYEELQSITPNCKVLISPQKNGYQDLHLAVNDLCALSTGEFLLLWNDDATMETQNPLLFPFNSCGMSNFVNPSVIVSIEREMAHNFINFPMD